MFFYYFFSLCIEPGRTGWPTGPLGTINLEATGCRPRRGAEPPPKRGSPRKEGAPGRESARLLAAFL